MGPEMTPLAHLSIAVPAALILLFLHGVGALLLAWAAFAWFAWVVIRVGTRWDR